ncbi:MAG: hypothetical protein GY862_10390 [Gammaproteobacteria bacterium]|nr:hypothetical protein [Gammaproteobacteria bacterium]
MKLNTRILPVFIFGFVSIFLQICNADTLDKAILRSSVVIGSVDLPETINPGQTYIINWMAQAYVPVKSKFVIIYSDGTKDSVNGFLTKKASGDYQISGISSIKYYFKTSYSVRTDKSGGVRVGFYNAQDDKTNPQWMFGIFPTGVISQPDGTAGKLFKVSLGQPIKEARVALLLHGLKSEPDTWNKFIGAQFSSKACSVITDGKIKDDPDPQENYVDKVMCYNVEFGQNDESSERTGLEGIKALSRSSGDFSTLTELGEEVRDAVKVIVKKYEGKRYIPRIMLIGHSRGGVAARAFLQNTGSSYSPAKKAIIGLVTTGTPHTGSPLGKFYRYLSDKCMKEDDDGHNKRDECSQDWKVVDFLRSDISCLLPVVVPLTVPQDLGIDLRKPGIGYLSTSSPHISNLITTSSNLPRNILYGEMTYSNLELGVLLSAEVFWGKATVAYSVFSRGFFNNICYQVSSNAQKDILGSSGSPGDAMNIGDGIVPHKNQKLPDSVRSGAVKITNYTHVLHTEEQKRQADLNAILNALVPSWEW